MRWPWKKPRKVAVRNGVLTLDASISKNEADTLVKVWNLATDLAREYTPSGPAPNAPRPIVPPGS